MPMDFEDHPKITALILKNKIVFLSVGMSALWGNKRKTVKIDLNLLKNSNLKACQEPGDLLSKISPPLTVPPASGTVTMPAAYKSSISSNNMPSQPRAASNSKKTKN